MKYHYLQCCFTYSMMQRPGGLTVVPVLALIFIESCVGDNVRWGVWLGRHIC